ncbi:MAG: hypothetical protein K1X71_18925 [Pirellulales bacterium]|nr:hypothetical protein [Pirellulales bacterium]
MPKLPPFIAGTLWIVGGAVTLSLYVLLVFRPVNIPDSNGMRGELYGPVAFYLLPISIGCVVAIGYGVYQIIGSLWK